tara:strand:- start:2279 stop:3205 length:927 start_codon:yes stop_codon:yes gene_type:complete
MAFEIAGSGYSNLSQGNFVPTIFSKNVQKFFRRAAVVEAITNTDYFGEIADHGDTVNIIKEPTVAISDYKRGLELETQFLADDQLQLTVDQAKYFQFIVDDIEKKQSHVNWEALATGSAAYTLKDNFDNAILSYISGQVASARTYGTDAAAGTDPTTDSIDLGYGAGEISPLFAMARAARLLDDANVPEENRWFVATPQWWEVMSDENSKLMGVDFTGDSASRLRNGKVTSGSIRGFECYKSNNLTAGSTAQVALFGHMSAVSTASQIAKTEVIRSEKFFGDIVRGMHLYGRKALRTDAIGKVFYLVD